MMDITISNWIALATLATIIVGLYKVFQEARAAKATADLASTNAGIAAMHAEQAHRSITAVQGSVAEIVVNTNGMQKRMEELARADERHIADDRDR